MKGWIIYCSNVFCIGWTLGWSGLLIYEYLSGNVKIPPEFLTKEEKEMVLNFRKKKEEEEAAKKAGGDSDNAGGDFGNVGGNAGGNTPSTPNSSNHSCVAHTDFDKETDTVNTGLDGETAWSPIEYIYNFFSGSTQGGSYHCDAAVNWQIGFQDPATAVMEAIINFHNDLFLFLVAIVTFVAWILYRCITLFEKSKNKKVDPFVHGTSVEVAWTLTPAMILIFIAIPSFALLYSMDEVIDPQLTVKALGHQWYWGYEYSDLETESGEDIAYDSYMYPDSEVTRGGFRLLETQLNMLLPVQTHVRLITTSADVIHSWAVPSFGVKLDACPGRLNQTSMFVKRLGRFYGQCSEICGVNHGFMPIAVSTLTYYDFMKAMAVKAERMGTKLLTV